MDTALTVFDLKKPSPGLFWEVYDRTVAPAVFTALEQALHQQLVPGVAHGANLLDAVTSALMHSLWQSATVGFLLWIVLVVLRHRTANARYLASCGALALMVALPVVTAVVLSQQTVPVASITPTAAVPAPSAGDVMLPPEPVWKEAQRGQVNWLALGVVAG